MFLSIALAAGLAGCSGAPTESGAGPSTDPGPVTLRQPITLPVTAARTSPGISGSVLLPICPIRRRPVAPSVLSATDIRGSCATADQAGTR
jgi:hypothetical protein